MNDDFCERARSDLARLLVYWREIERWIKKAEQVNNETPIPAINELRYASRQLLNAQNLFSKSPLDKGERDVISKRLIIAEQYLKNADHDIVDGIVTFYRGITNDIEQRIGRTGITEHYPTYPMLTETIRKCELLISDSRGEYAKRIENYAEIRAKYFLVLVAQYDGLLDAQIGAQEAANRAERNLAIAKGRYDLLWWAGITGWPVAAAALFLSYFAWTTPYDDFCSSKRLLAKVICSKAEKSISMTPTRDPVLSQPAPLTPASPTAPSPARLP